MLSTGLTYHTINFKIVKENEKKNLAVALYKLIFVGINRFRFFSEKYHLAGLQNQNVSNAADFYIAHKLTRILSFASMYLHMHGP